MLVFWICRLLKTRKYTAYYDPKGRIPIKKEPIRTPGFPSRLSWHLVRTFIIARNRDWFSGWDKQIAKFCTKIQIFSASTIYIVIFESKTAAGCPVNLCRANCQSILEHCTLRQYRVPVKTTMIKAVRVEDFPFPTGIFGFKIKRWKFNSNWVAP